MQVKSIEEVNGFELTTDQRLEIEKAFSSQAQVWIFSSVIAAALTFSITDDEYCQVLRQLRDSQIAIITRSGLCQCPIHHPPTVEVKRKYRSWH